MDSTLKKDEKAFVAMPMGNISTLDVVGAPKTQRGANGSCLLFTAIWEANDQVSFLEGNATIPWCS